MSAGAIKPCHLNRLFPVLILLSLLAGCTFPTFVSSPTPRFEEPPVSTPPPSPTPVPSPTPLPTQSYWLDWTRSDNNVALKKKVRVSRESYGRGGLAAVDGTLRTQWNSGAGPTQWIEIDLGRIYNIGEIRLTPALFKPGVTFHAVLGRSPWSSQFQTLYIFNNQVSDSPLLAYPPMGAWVGIQVIRIETIYSAAPIGWKEIEIFEAVQ